MRTSPVMRETAVPKAHAAKPYYDTNAPRGGTPTTNGRLLVLALPPVSPQQDAMQARLQQLLGPDEDETPLGPPELVPAMQKVVQAAGRVLRTPEDRGWLWLLDERYARPEVVALLPP